MAKIEIEDYTTRTLTFRLAKDNDGLEALIDVNGVFKLQATDLERSSWTINFMKQGQTIPWLKAKPLLTALDMCVQASDADTYYVCQDISTAS